MEGPIKKEETRPGDNLETKLSPEVLERVMEKVVDINKQELAYSVASRLSGKTFEKLEEILKTGLGKHLSKKIFSLVHFNIVGRAFEIPDDKMQIQKSYWFRQRSDEQYAPSQVAIIFDLSKYKEIAPAVGEKPNTIAKYNNKYYCNMHSWLAEALTQNGLREMVPGDPKVLNHPAFETLKRNRYLDEPGRPVPFTENGFILHGGVSPDLFIGVVVWNGSSGEEMRDLLTNNMLTNFHQENNTHSLLPIYDASGNLLWPKEMNYEEVKKFAEEKDKIKKR